MHTLSPWECATNVRWEESISWLLVGFGKVIMAWMFSSRGEGMKVNEVIINFLFFTSSTPAPAR